MTLRIKSPQDVGAAIILIAIGLAGLWFGRDYDIGSVSRMGPGYMPALLSIGLLVFGAVIGLRRSRSTVRRSRPAGGTRAS